MFLPGPGPLVHEAPPGNVVGATIYNDSGSGTLVLSGVASESQSHSISASGTLTLSGTKSESQSHSKTAAGTLTLSGTRTESLVATESRSGTLTLSGTAVESFGIIFTDSRSGTITLAGTRTEAWGTSQTATGTLVLSGTGVEGTVVAAPAAQSAPGGDYSLRGVPEYEVYGYSERHDRADDDVIALLLSLL